MKKSSWVISNEDRTTLRELSQKILQITDKYDWFCPDNPNFVTPANRVKHAAKELANSVEALPNAETKTPKGEI